MRIEECNAVASLDIDGVWTKTILPEQIASAKIPWLVEGVQRFFQPSLGYAQHLRVLRTYAGLWILERRRIDDDVTRAFERLKRGKEKLAENNITLGLAIISERPVIGRMGLVRQLGIDKEDFDFCWLNPFGADHTQLKENIALYLREMGIRHEHFEDKIRTANRMSLIGSNAYVRKGIDVLLSGVCPAPNVTLVDSYEEASERSLNSIRDHFSG